MARVEIVGAGRLRGRAAGHGLCVLLLALIACGTSSTAPGDAGTPGADAGNDGASLDGPQTDACAVATTPSADCTNGGPCPTLAIAGDNPAPAGSDRSFFHGFADPSVREDPTTHRLWLAYSAPRVAPTAGLDGGLVDVSLAESHLAHSDDRGVTWTMDAPPIFAATPTTDPAGSGESGYLASEVPSLARGDDGTWYAIHLVYFQRPIAGYNPRPKSFQLRVAKAGTPAEFASQDPATHLVLGTHFTDAVYQAQDLNATHPSLTDCPLWNDAAVFVRGGKLYVVAECQTQDPTQESVVVFSTTTAGDPKTWSLAYVGVLAGHALAVEVGTQLGLTSIDELMQVDLALAPDGKLLTLLTPTQKTAGSGASTEVHQGCVALELASLDPPTPARDCAGKLVLRARVAASDEPNGTSSCGYDPASTTGILLARRPDGKSANGIVDGFSLVASGILPRPAN